MDGDGGIVVDPQDAARVDGRPEAPHKAPGGRRAIPAGNFAKGEAGDPRRDVVACRRAEQPRGGAAKLAIAVEDQDLRSGLVHDRERIALAVLGGDNPAGKFDHGVGDFLAGGKFIDGGGRFRDSLVGIGHANARERQRQGQRPAKGQDGRR